MALNISTGFAKKIAAAGLFLSSFSPGAHFQLNAEEAPDASKSLHAMNVDNVSALSRPVSQQEEQAADFREAAQAVDDSLDDKIQQAIKEYDEDIERLEGVISVFKVQLADMDHLYNTLLEAQWMDRIPQEAQRQALDVFFEIDNDNQKNEVHSLNQLISDYYNAWNDHEDLAGYESDEFRRRAMEWLAESHADRLRELNKKTIIHESYTKTREALKEGDLDEARRINNATAERLEHISGELSPEEESLIYLKHRVEYLTYDLDYLQEEQEALKEEHEFVKTADWQMLIPQDIYEEMAAKEDLVLELEEEVQNENRPDFKGNLEKRLRKEQNTLENATRNLKAQVHEQRPIMLENLEKFHELSTIREIEVKQELAEAQQTFSYVKDQIARGTFVVPEKKSSDITLQAEQDKANQTNSASAAPLEYDYHSMDKNKQTRITYKRNIDDVGNYRTNVRSTTVDDDDRITRIAYNKYSRTNIHRRGFNEREGFYYRKHTYDPNYGKPFPKRSHVRVWDRQRESQWIDRWGNYHGHENRDIGYRIYKEGNLGRIEIFGNILRTNERNGFLQGSLGGGTIRLQIRNPLSIVGEAPRP